MTNNTIFFLNDTESTTQGIVYDKLNDALTPGAQIEFSPNEAFMAGAFLEDALSEEDARDSDIDVQDAVAILTINE